MSLTAEGNFQVGINGSGNKVGRLIYISGASFSGKTYLSSMLINDFDLKVIQFEKHLNHTSLENKYRSFYKDIQQELEQGNNVLCEAAYSSYRNPVLIYKFDNILDIVCYPSNELHQKNYQSYLNKYGKDITVRRTGNATLSYLRKDFIKKGCPNKWITFKGDNYNDIKSTVRYFLEKGD